MVYIHQNVYTIYIEVYIQICFFYFFIIVYMIMLKNGYFTAINFLEFIFQLNPDKRPSIDEIIVTHLFFLCIYKNLKL